MSEPVRKRRILVIDDSEAIHQDFWRILCPVQSGDRAELDELEEAVFGRAEPSEQATREVFELDSAYQGEEAFAKVQQAVETGRPFALAFLDYRMPPGWDGFETLRHLRQVAPSLPVVLCSAYSDYSWEELTRVLGEAHHLVELRKPFNKYELCQMALALTEQSAAPEPAQSP